MRGVKGVKIERLVVWMTAGMLGLGASGRVSSQGQAPAAPTAAAPTGAGAVFEVASMRLSPPGGDGMTAFSLYDGPRITLRNVTLGLLIQLAFGVESYQMGELPKWADSSTYDISATTDGTVALTYEQLKPLLQQLLVERLHLKAHRATKDAKGYGLVVAKGGSKLVVSKGPGRMAQILPGGLQAAKIDMKTFAAMLAGVIKRPVVNKTGVEGDYDIELAYAPEGSEDSALPSLFTALQETMGLRLETQTVPVEMLVLDAVDKVPVEN